MNLAQAAFGDRPDLLITTHPTNPRDRWLAAVVLGGQARYAAAATLLADLITGRDAELAALAAATLAAHRRQLGGHAAARTLDAMGLSRLAKAGHHPPTADCDEGAFHRSRRPEGGLRDGERSEGGLRGSGRSEGGLRGSGRSEGGLRGGGRPEGGLQGGPNAAEAMSDVLLGLAADAVGAGRLAEARRLHASAAHLPGWRGAIRAGWVDAEIELSAGRADLAAPPATAAAELAADSGSIRHRIKSDLVLGAALGAGAERAAARKLVTRARDDATDLDLLSLVWPAALILAELDPTGAAAHCRCAAVALHSVLHRADPRGRELAERSPWVPSVTGPTG